MTTLDGGPSNPPVFSGYKPKLSKDWAALFQPGGISGSINWWKDNSFNSPSSDYLYQSFRTKVQEIFFYDTIFFYFLLIKISFNQVFEPLISGILADVKKLKEGQATSNDTGYGSLAAAILAVIGLLFMLFKMKSVENKRSLGSQMNNLPNQKEISGRVL